jgi:hypothetical protein
LTTGLAGAGAALCAVAWFRPFPSIVVAACAAGACFGLALLKFRRVAIAAGPPTRSR